MKGDVKVTTTNDVKVNITTTNNQCYMWVYTHIKSWNYDIRSAQH